MPAADYLTWDGDGGSNLPRRPSTEDLGGDDKVNDAEYPPDDVEHPTADGWNQKVKQIAALSKVAEACKIEVRYNAGAPFIARVTAPGTNIVTTTFTVTDMGVGDTKIEWPANTFPPHQLSPTGLTALSTGLAVGSVEEITNGIRVRMFDLLGPADVGFTIELN